MMAMYNSAEDGPKVVDAFSDNLVEFSTSSICAGFRNEFGNYIFDTLGLYDQRRANNLEPEVYPDRTNDYMPMLPEVGDLNTAEISLLRRLLRTYFNQLWIWQGGRGAAPYTAIAEDCLQGRWSYLDRSCLPASVSRLQDPSAMVSLEAREWYKRIQGDVKPAFYFAKITKKDGSVLCHYTGGCFRRHPKSRLEWSANSILVARKVEEQRSTHGLQSAAWSDLPVARTFGTFVPFTDMQKRLLRDYSTPEHDLLGLADLCAELETLGVAHQTDCAEHGPNAHAPPDLWHANLSDIFDKVWPNSSLFNPRHDSHPQYAMTTLIHWIKTNLQMRHSKSGTWLGGPAGARWNIVLLFHMVRAFTHLDKKRAVPSEIARCFSAEAHEQHWHMANATIGWLRGELESTRDKLRETCNDRANAWSAQVKTVYLAQHSFARGAVVSGVPLIRAETYAVPVDDAALHSCYEHIIQTAPGAPSTDVNVSRAVEHSVENISIPSFNSSVSLSSHGEPSDSEDDFDTLAEQTVAQLRLATTPPPESPRTKNQPSGSKPPRPKPPRKHLVSPRANRAATYKSVRVRAKAPRKSPSELLFVRD
ncbi:hypothetical protein FRC08_014656 [Ceratobasidium sp. 394]|nr:hypothetical protein FRC08_014656 [Ceratobasidium sp. 394]